MSGVDGALEKQPPGSAGKISQKDSQKASKKGAQGSPLPPDGSPLSRYPIGSCVFLEIDRASAWYLIAFRIGGSGNPHLRKLSYPPTSLDWNASPDDAREYSDRLVVQQSNWPLRIADDRTLHAESDPDPVLGGSLRLDGSPDLVGSVARAQDGGGE